MTEFFSSSDVKNDDTDGDSTNSTRKRAYALPKASLKGGKGLSQLSASRLVAVLFHLASANVSVVYVMLCDRVMKGGEVVKRIQHKSDGLSDPDREGKSEVGKGCKESDEEEKGDEDKGETKDDDDTHIAHSAHGHVEMEEEHEGRSTESLLEMMMPLFAHSNFTSSSSDLSELTAFINVVSAPLEFLGDGSPTHMVRCVSVCLFVCLFVCFVVYLSICLYVLFACVSVLLSTGIGGSFRHVLYPAYLSFFLHLLHPYPRLYPYPTAPHPTPPNPLHRLNLN